MDKTTVVYVNECPNTACKVITFAWEKLGDVCPGCRWVGRGTDKGCAEWGDLK